ncbi:MAG TPA: hypothetical protein VF765_34860 [Polyangiaceae bacterium]
MKLLTHPENVAYTRGTLLRSGIGKQDVDEALQDVYVKALTAFQRGVAPADLEEMKAFCAKVAREHAIEVLRKVRRRTRDLVASCEVDEIAPLGSASEQRDPVDAGRQLEVLAQLFREGTMPKDGVDILEGIACGCTMKEVGEDLRVTQWAVRGRLDTMRKMFRERMEELGLLDRERSLEEVIALPGAIATLREAA